MKTKRIMAIIFALLASVLYAINIPLSKLLLNKIEPTMMASYLYLGAGIGIGILYLITKKKQKSSNKEITKKDISYIIGMVVLDILA